MFLLDVIEHDVLQCGRLMRHSGRQGAAQDERLGPKAARAYAHDRRGVILAMSAGVALTAAGFAVQAWLDLRSVGLLYALVAAQSRALAVLSRSIAEKILSFKP